MCKSTESKIKALRAAKEKLDEKIKKLQEKEVKEAAAENKKAAKKAGKKSVGKKGSAKKGTRLVPVSTNNRKSRTQVKEQAPKVTVE